MKSLMVGKWLLVCGLCLALFGMSTLLGACSLLAGGGSSTSMPNGSVESPYPLTVSKGTCTAWKIVFDNSGGDPLCAQTLPTQQVGIYVQLSYENIPQTVCIVSIDARRQVVDVQ